MGRQCFMRTELQFGEDEKVLDGGDGCTTI